MFNAELFLSSIRIKSVIIVPVLLVFTISGLAQSDLRDAVYGKPKSTTKPSTSKTVTKSKVSPKPTPAKTATVATKTASSSKLKKTSVKLLPVVFTAKESFVEVWLNDKNIGQTDTNFQVSKKLAPGEYRLMAKNKRQVLISKKITVDVGQTEFDLFEKLPPVLKVIETKVETEQPKEKTEAEIIEEQSAKVKKIFEIYETPSTTDQVTLDDWQHVLKYAHFGQFQGFTSVQIEAQKWFASGQIEFAKKEYTNAFTAYNKAWGYMPMWAFPYYELGNTYMAKNQLADAIKLYQKALQLNNRMGMIYKKLGDAQNLSGKEKEALSAYELAAQFGYRTFETRFLIAKLRVENKQIDKGIEEFEALIKESPNAELYVRLGEAYEKVKRDLPAIASYEKAISLDPNAVQAHSRIGGIFFNQREYTRAKASLEKAIALDPAGKVLDIKDAQKKLREIAVKSNR